MFLLVPAYPGSPGQKAVKRLRACVRVCELYTGMIYLETHQNMSSITTTLQSNRQEENSTRMVI